MVAIYVRRINEGMMTLEEVPKLWRAKVAKALQTSETES
jgi:hypothetical protein